MCQRALLAMTLIFTYYFSTLLLYFVAILFVELVLNKSTTQTYTRQAENQKVEKSKLTQLILA
jgi:hypothetical protein